MPIHLDLLEEVIMEKVELWLAEMHCGGLLTFQCVAPSLLPLQFYSSLFSPPSCHQGTLFKKEEAASRALYQVQSNSFCVRR